MLLLPDNTIKLGSPPNEAMLSFNQRIARLTSIKCVGYAFLGAKRYPILTVIYGLSVSIWSSSGASRMPLMCYPIVLCNHHFLKWIECILGTHSPCSAMNMDLVVFVNRLMNAVHWVYMILYLPKQALTQHHWLMETPEKKCRASSFVAGQSLGVSCPMPL